MSWCSRSRRLAVGGPSVERRAVRPGAGVHRACRPTEHAGSPDQAGDRDAGRQGGLLRQPRPAHRQRLSAGRDAATCTPTPTAARSSPSDVQFEVVVPKDRIFVMGDHRDLSADSRCHLSDLSTSQAKGQVAFVPIDLVVGPAFAIAAPFDRAARLQRPATFAGVPAATGPAACRSGDQARRGDLLMADGGRVPRCWSDATAGSTATSARLQRVGLDPVAGADEAGRGACAGPLVAARGDPVRRQVEADRRPEGLQAADRAQRERLLRRDHREGRRLVGGRRSSPQECDAARHARGQRDGPADGAAAAGRGADVRA